MDWNRQQELTTLIEQGRFDEVEAELTNLADAETDPLAKAVILWMISDGLRFQSRFSAALSKLDEACATLGSTHETYPRLLLAKAVMDIDQKNWKAALKKLNHIIKTQSTLLKIEDNADVFQEVQRNRGIALFELGRDADALPLLESVRSTDYQRERTLYSIAAANIQLSNLDAAILAFQELLTLNPSSVYRSYAHYNIGRIHYDRRQLARAKMEFEECLACPDRGNLNDKHILQALVYTCQALNLEEDASRYAEVMRKI
jgi:tetratricopeptide (TPR) repeat protein